MILGNIKTNGILGCKDWLISVFWASFDDSAGQANWLLDGHMTGEETTKFKCLKQGFSISGLWPL